MRSQASLKEILRRRTDNLEIVRLQYKGGKENKGSLLLAEASVEQTQLEIFSLNATIDKYLNQLCAELGRESCSSMQLVDDTSPFEIKIPDEPQFSQLADSTLRFKQQDLNLKVSRSRWEGARSGFYPKLDASVGMTESGWTMFSGDGSLTSSLVLSIPIFTGGSDYYELAARRLELRSSELQLQYLKSKIQTVLSEIHSNWKAAQIKEKVEVSFLKAARLRAKIARGRYNNGLMSFEDWERLEGELISREKNSITSQRDRLLTAAQWELALIMGDL
jgi:outer membrane protein TolC